MISDVANWVLINVLTNTRVFTSLLALIILIVAGFLISDKKPAKKVPSKRILGAGLFVFATFVFLYANIADLADVFTVWATLVLAGVAIFSFEESRHLREENRQRDERERKERLLNEIIDWATDVRKYASIPHIIDPNSYNRMMSADRFFTLKYNGKKFLIAVKKQVIGDDLQSLLSNAIEFLEKNWRDFATKPSRCEEIVKDLDKIGETIIEKAEDLLSSNS